MVPQWLNPKSYLNADIRVQSSCTIIVKNVDPFNQHCTSTGVNLKFEHFGSHIKVWASIHGEPFGFNGESSEINVLSSDKMENRHDLVSLFDFLLDKGRKDEDQYRKNCHIRILKVLDGPDSEAAKHEIQLTPRELNND